MDEQHDTIDELDETEHAPGEPQGDEPNRAVDEQPVTQDAPYGGTDDGPQDDAAHPLVPVFLSREEYEKVGDDPEPLPRGFEVIDGGTSSWPTMPPFRAKDASALQEHGGPATESTDESQAGRATETAPNAGECSGPVADGQQAAGTDREDGPSAAQVVGSLISAGMGAVREVSAAKRAHASAREHLDYLEQTIEDQQEELAHRRDIVERYDLIIEDQTARQDEARTAVAQALARQDAARALIDGLKQQLKQMRDEDARTEKLLKSAVEAAEAKEASSRESGSRMQRRLDDANRALQTALTEKEAAVAAAQHNIDSAAARLEALTEELREIQRNPSANSAAYSVRSNELEFDISDASAQLREAKDALPRITQEVEHSIEVARAVVQSAQEPIEAAKRAHEAVTAEADEARDALDAAKNEASQRQRDLRDRISDQEKELKKLERAAAEAEAASNEAQAVMDDATEIKNHPEIIESLAIDLERNIAEQAEQLREVEQLAATERDVRQRTRSSRLRFMGMVGGAVAVVLIVIALWFILS